MYYTESEGLLFEMKGVNPGVTIMRSSYCAVKWFRGIFPNSRVSD